MAGTVLTGMSLLPALLHRAPLRRSATGAWGYGGGPHGAQATVRCIVQQWCLRVSGCMHVCVLETLLMQEHVDSPGVVEFSLMGTRVPDVA